MLMPIAAADAICCWPQVVVVVMNNDSPLERHTAFYAAQRKHADNAAFVFVENDGSLQDADPSARDRCVCAFGLCCHVCAGCM